MSMTGTIMKSEVLTGPERRRRRTPSEKLAIVAETQESGVTVSLFLRQADVGGLLPNLATGCVGLRQRRRRHFAIDGLKVRAARSLSDDKDFVALGVDDERALVAQ